MSGLFRKLSSRRSAGPEGSEPTAAEQGTTDATTTPSSEEREHVSLLKDPAAPTQVLREAETPHQPLTPEPPPDHTVFIDAPAPFVAPPVQPAPAGYVPPPVEPVADLPAGLDPDELGAAPGASARRGKIRRRVAFLRAARELLLRDLGGFVYEVHRTAHDIEHEAHRRLRETKLNRLTRVDAELHELEYRLDDVRRQVLVREPGVGGECPHCGELFASSAHYCSNCGNPLTESARRQLARAQEPVVVSEEPVAASQPVAPIDQPTQEIPPLDPDHPAAEFQWPRRESAPETPGGGSAADADEVTPRAEADEVTPRTEAGEVTPQADAGEATPQADAGEATPRADADEATPADAEAVPPRDDAGEATPQADAGAVPARDDAGAVPARDDAGETTPQSDAGAVPPRDDASEVPPRADAGEVTPPAEAADAPQAAAASDDVDATPSGTSDDATTPSDPPAQSNGASDPLQARNGSAQHDDPILRPVERRQ